MAAYSAGIWLRVESWVRGHRVKGVEFAAKVAGYGACNFPEWAVDCEWSPLRGARPSADQISEMMQLIRWSK